MVALVRFGCSTSCTKVLGISTKLIDGTTKNAVLCECDFGLTKTHPFCDRTRGDVSLFSVLNIEKPESTPVSQL